ncbi:hypothetical protein Tco_1347978, partial [Tanacetum coccineum]
GASCTQGTVSSIPIVGSICPEDFLLPILLLVMIISTVVVTVVVVVAVGGIPSILKLSFMVIGFLTGDLIGFFYSNRLVCAFRAVATLSATSFLMAA